MDWNRTLENLERIGILNQFLMMLEMESETGMVDQVVEEAELDGGVGGWFCESARSLFPMRRETAGTAEAAYVETGMSDWFKVGLFHFQFINSPRTTSKSERTKGLDQVDLFCFSALFAALLVVASSLLSGDFSTISRLSLIDSEELEKFRTEPLLVTDLLTILFSLLIIDCSCAGLTVTTAESSSILASSSWIVSTHKPHVLSAYLSGHIPKHNLFGYLPTYRSGPFDAPPDCEHIDTR
ncbi:hypothetical protein BLNAU_18412 [Blattamonas nauphoetae]|uniref:Uncharacterized protein n=1 Tax=Blattamonas nauphoetae TaxID=2049346 RepID=A0ABQ9X8Z6_9EUKA|nr:hypothetical protein BLNAU_18412 [Blattamonas nauphoetae]